MRCPQLSQQLQNLRKNGHPPPRLGMVPKPPTTSSHQSTQIPQQVNHRVPGEEYRRVFYKRTQQSFCVEKLVPEDRVGLGVGLLPGRIRLPDPRVPPDLSQEAIRGAD